MLEDSAFRMVGGSELIRVNVRIITATNKKLQAAVADEKFREDLFYRLQIVPILMPPLRERAEDIPLLRQFFRALHGQTQTAPQAHVRRGGANLPAVPWPGNVRQLRNTIERLVITCRESVVSVEQLPDFFREYDQNSTTFTVRPGMPLAEVEKLLIRQTLTHVTSNRAEAAKALGISRRALQYKLKHYGLLERAENQLNNGRIWFDLRADPSASNCAKPYVAAEEPFRFHHFRMQSFKANRFEN